LGTGICHILLHPLDIDHIHAHAKIVLKRAVQGFCIRQYRDLDAVFL
jgi:hypothetical protein